MITFCKAILSGATPDRVREQTTGLTSAALRELAVLLAADPELTVSVITYENGEQELEVLQTGPPQHTPDTIDHRSFTRQPGRALSVNGQDGLHDAITTIRDLLDATPAAPSPRPGTPPRTPRMAPRAPTCQDRLGRQQPASLDSLASNELGCHAARRRSTMRVVVIRHHDVDSAHFIGAAFEARGAELTVHLWPDDGPLPSVDGVDHVVVLGAISSVNDPDPWIAEELAWLREVDEAGVPVLGICFGAQAICAALGGRVEAMDRKEIGWRLVDSADPELVPAGPWLEFHGDRCLPPSAATVLARNDVAVQAFRLGRHLAVQFHPEVDGPQLKRWLDAGGSGQAEKAGLHPDQFLADTVREETAAQERADRLVAAAIRLHAMT